MTLAAGTRHRARDPGLRRSALRPHGAADQGTPTSGQFSRVGAGTASDGALSEMQNPGLFCGYVLCE